MNHGKESSVDSFNNETRYPIIIQSELLQLLFDELIIKHDESLLNPDINSSTNMNDDSIIFFGDP